MKTLDVSQTWPLFTVYRLQYVVCSSASFAHWHCISSAILLKVCSYYAAIDPFPIRRATSVPLWKGKKFALHHGKMSTTKRRAIQILHISTFQFTFKRGYNDFISKYTDVNSLHVTQINLLHNNNNNICYSTYINSLVSGVKKDLCVWTQWWF